MCREISGETAHLHRPIRTIAGHLYLIPFVDEWRKLWWDCTYAQTHPYYSWSPIPYTVCRWVEKALVRLHICADSLEPSIYNYYSYLESCCEIAHMHWLILTFSGHIYSILFVDEQRKLWWDCTYAQAHLNLRWSPKHIPFVDEQRKRWWPVNVKVSLCIC